MRRRRIDVTRGAEISFTNAMEAVTFATTGLAPGDQIPGLRRKEMHHDGADPRAEGQLGGHGVLQAPRKPRPKYGRDDDRADAMALEVMQLWTEETWKHRTRSTNRRFRPGMLSWNYWAGDGYIMAASPDGRPRGKFLQRHLPSNGADINGPTANANSVGKALGAGARRGPATMVIT